MGRIDRKTCRAVVAFAALLSLCRAVAAEEGAIGEDGWREDLRVLVETIESTPPSYAAADLPAFLEAADRLRARIPSLSDPDIEIELARLLALLNDGHTELGLNQGAAGFGEYPLWIANFGGELRVFAALAPWAELVGGRPTRVGERSVGELIGDLAPLISRDNEHEITLTAPVYLRLGEVLRWLGASESATHAEWTIETEAGARTVELEVMADDDFERHGFVRARDGAPTEAVYLQDRGRLYWSESLRGGSVRYLRVHRCLDEDEPPSLSEFFAAELEAAVEAEAEALVIDLRGNRGGNYELTLPVIESLRSSPFNAAGRLFVLQDHETFSAAAVFALLLRRGTEARIVGQPSRARPNGSDNMELLELPSSGLIVTYTDRVLTRAPELADSPILPVDIPAFNRFADYASGHDRVLETALAVAAASSPR